MLELPFILCILTKMMSFFSKTTDLPLKTTMNSCALCTCLVGAQVLIGQVQAVGYGFEYQSAAISERGIQG